MPPRLIGSETHLQGLMYLYLFSLRLDFPGKVDFLNAASWHKHKLSQNWPSALVWWWWCYLGHNIVGGTLCLVGRCLFCKWKWTAVLLLGNRIICCWSDYGPLTSALTVIVFCLFLFRLYTALYCQYFIRWISDQFIYTETAQI